MSSPKIKGSTIDHQFRRTGVVVGDVRRGAVGPVRRGERRGESWEGGGKEIEYVGL